MPEIEQETIAAQSRQGEESTSAPSTGDAWDLIDEGYSADHVIGRLAGLYTIAMNDDSLDDPDLDPEDWEPPPLI
ncbi:hypothetical protein [Acrocarpospora phusangensis]|nr:hypothetical protein [Acrocarpospora phusangensis]